MSDIKPEWVEAGGRAYLRGLHIDDGAALRDWDRTIAAAVIAAVEPIIRADERAKAPVHSTGTDTGGPCCECCYEVGGRNFHLRAQVEALPTTRTRAWDKGWDSVSLNDVLALLGGES